MAEETPRNNCVSSFPRDQNRSVPDRINNARAVQIDPTYNSSSDEEAEGLKGVTGALELKNMLGRTEEPESKTTCIEMHDGNCSRLMSKRGSSKVEMLNIVGMGKKYMVDVFVTLVDMPWRWCLLSVTSGFFGSWILFAAAWYLLVLARGEMGFIQEEHPEVTPCIGNVKSFPGALMFSIETQTTIGYGFSYINDHCPEMIALVAVQSVIGVIFESFLVGIVLAKLSKPTRRKVTLLFSKNAVISQREGRLCLMFRIGDFRKSYVVGAKVKGFLVQRRVTREGEVIPCFQEELKLRVDGRDKLTLLLWPIVVTHVIDPESPLFHVSQQDLPKQKFEVILTVKGCIESTGSTTEVRSSYLPNEIKWGYRFKDMIELNEITRHCRVDYSVFHEVQKVPTPSCCAKDLDKKYELDN